MDLQTQGTPVPVTYIALGQTAQNLWLGPEGAVEWFPEDPLLGA